MQRPLMETAQDINHILPGSMDAGLLVPEGGTTKEEGLAQAQAQQATQAGLMAKAMRRNNALDERGAAEGSDAIAADKLEQEFKSKKDEIERMVAANPKMGDHDLVGALREEYDLRKKIAAVQHLQIQAQYDMASVQAKTSLGFDPDAIIDTANHSKAVDNSRAKLDAARNELQRLVKANLDDRAAKKALESATVEHYQTVNTASASVRAAESETRQMELQAIGQDKLAQVEAVRAEYAAKILASQQAGTTEITSQLQTQSSLKQLEARADANQALWTPDQQRAQKKAEFEKAQKLGRQANFEKRHAEAMAANNTGASFDAAFGAPLPSFPDLSSTVGVPSTDPGASGNDIDFTPVTDILTDILNNCKFTGL